MKKHKAGSLDYLDVEFTYYTDDFVTFYKDNDEELSEEVLNEWAIWLNSPWSQAHDKYLLSCNCENAYTKMDENEPVWKCEYFVIGMEAVTASVFGYGNTEAEALENCIKHFRLLQEKYNAEGENL